MKQITISSLQQNKLYICEIYSWCKSLIYNYMRAMHIFLIYCIICGLWSCACSSRPVPFRVFSSDRAVSTRTSGRRVLCYLFVVQSLWAHRYKRKVYAHNNSKAAGIVTGVSILLSHFLYQVINKNAIVIHILINFSVSLWKYNHKWLLASSNYFINLRPMKKPFRIC